MDDAEVAAGAVYLLIGLGVFIALIVTLISRLGEAKREDFEKRDN